MKKTLAILLVVCTLLSLCACGKSKEATTADELILAIGEVTLGAESKIVAAKAFYDTLTPEQKLEVENVAILESAIQVLNELKINMLLDNGEYEDALALLKTMEQTAEVMEYTRRASFGVLAECIFQNGAMGTAYGTSGDDCFYFGFGGSEMIFSVVPSATGFESISFGLMPSDPKGILTAENYLLTIYEDNNQFNYFYMFMFGESIYAWDGQATCSDYTRETPIDFEISLMPETSVWQISSTEEESKLSTRDDCNAFLDEIALLLRRIDCGVTLKDLGFYAYE